jgi:hypothetical protein
LLEMEAGKETADPVDCNGPRRGNAASSYNESAIPDRMGADGGKCRGFARSGAGK